MLAGQHLCIDMTVDLSQASGMARRGGKLRVDRLASGALFAKSEETGNSSRNVFISPSGTQKRDAAGRARVRLPRYNSYLGVVVFTFFFFYYFLNFF